MPRRSPTAAASDGTVHRTAAEVPPASDADLARLRAAMVGAVDTTDIPEKAGPFVPLTRDARGNLPRRHSPIREAVVAELRRRKVSAYQVWKLARRACPMITRPAVYEFLDGTREISLPYAEAILEALGLAVVALGSGVPKAAGDGRSPRPDAGAGPPEDAAMDPER